MKYNLIAAFSTNGVIGKDGALPWHLPTDLNRFKTITRGHTIVMGRKTYESIGRVLPNRVNVVISSTDIDDPKIIVMRSIEDTKKLPGKIFYIGGEGIYREALQFVDAIFITRVYMTIKGDNLSYFPIQDLNLKDFDLEYETDLKENNTICTFFNYVRKGHSL